MRTAIVPAQITTIEDKVAGNLSMTQLILVLMPALLGGLIFASFAPALRPAPYKIVLVLLVAIVFGASAIRIQGKLVILWAVVMLRYALRPRYHIFNKNSAYLRNIPIKEKPEVTEAVVQEAAPEVTTRPSLSIAEIVRLQNLIAHPSAKLQFTTNKKGALSVRITEVKQENLVA